MIEPQLPIGLTATAPAIPGDDIPSPPMQRMGHPTDVRLVAVTFQPMGQHRHSWMPSRPGIQIQKIIIRGIDPRSLPRHARHPTTDRRPNRLQVAMRQPPRWSIGGFNQRHTCRSSPWHRRSERNQNHRPRGSVGLSGFASGNRSARSDPWHPTTPETPSSCPERDVWDSRYIAPTTHPSIRTRVVSQTV